MVTPNQVQVLALSFAESSKSPHFEKTSFRVRKKIFATMNSTQKEVVVKLTETDQDIFCSAKGGAIKPVDGAWGKKGWTLVKLDSVDDELFKSVLTRSYVTVAPKKLSALYSDK